MKRGISSSAMFTLAVEGLFLAGFFLLVVFGAGTYRQAVENQAENSRTRALLSYFSTRAKSCDTQGGAELYQEDGRQVLNFPDADSGYAVRVYLYDGQLMEDYGLDGAPLSPESATVIGQTETFQVEAQDDGAFIVSTDAGKAVFSLKAGKVYGG